MDFYNQTGTDLSRTQSELHQNMATSCPAHQQLDHHVHQINKMRQTTIGSRVNAFQTTTIGSSCIQGGFSIQAPLEEISLKQQPSTGLNVVKTKAKLNVATTPCARNLSKIANLTTKNNSNTTYAKSTHGGAVLAKDKFSSYNNEQIVPERDTRKTRNTSHQQFKTNPVESRAKRNASAKIDFSNATNKNSQINSRNANVTQIGSSALVKSINSIKQRRKEANSSSVINFAYHQKLVDHYKEQELEEIIASENQNAEQFQAYPEHKTLPRASMISSEKARISNFQTENATAEDSVASLRHATQDQSYFRGITMNPTNVQTQMSVSYRASSCVKENESDAKAVHPARRHSRGMSACVVRPSSTTIVGATPINHLRLKQAQQTRPITSQISVDDNFNQIKRKSQTTKEQLDENDEKIVNRSIIHASNTLEVPQSKQQSKRSIRSHRPSNSNKSNRSNNSNNSKSQRLSSQQSSDRTSKHKGIPPEAKLQSGKTQVYQMRDKQSKKKVDDKHKLLFIRKGPSIGLSPTSNAGNIKAEGYSQINIAEEKSKDQIFSQMIHKMDQVFDKHGNSLIVKSRLASKYVSLPNQGYSRHGRNVRTLTDVAVSGPDFKNVQFIQPKQQQPTEYDLKSMLTKIPSKCTTKFSNQTPLPSQSTRSQPMGEINQDGSSDMGQVYTQIIDSLTLKEKIKYGLVPPTADPKYKPPVKPRPYSYTKSHVRKFVQQPIRTMPLTKPHKYQPPRKTLLMHNQHNVNDSHHILKSILSFNQAKVCTDSKNPLQGNAKLGELLEAFDQMEQQN